MAESPFGYLPDVLPGAEPNIVVMDSNTVDISVSRNLRKVRRVWGPTAGLRRWSWPTTLINQATRQIVRAFLKARQGEFDAFYMWNPAPEVFEDAAAGTVTAASVFVIPFRVTSSQGNVIGTLSDVRVAGITKAFTRRALLPRTGTYAVPRFDGSTSNIDCGTGSSLKFAGDITACAWVYVNSLTGNMTIVSNYSTNASGTSFKVIAGALTFKTGFASSANSATCTTNLVADVWTHVAAVKSGTNVTFYINGVAKNTVAAITNQAAATISTKLGQELSTDRLSGLLSDVRIYNSALSAGEVTNIYNGAATPSANLLGWWRLIEGTGTAADWSGNANNGTLSGATWVAGEEEITFGAGAQTGAVTVWGTLRDRVVAGYDGASRRGRFAKSPNLMTALDIALVELY